MILHAAEEDLVAVGEAARIGRALVVPLAGAEGGIARGLEGFAHGRVVGRDLLAFAVKVKEGAPGVEHGPAGHADRARSPAWDVGVLEGRASGRQLVEIGRLDPRIAQRADGVEALVVGEEEENVRFHVDCLLPEVVTAFEDSYTGCGANRPRMRRMWRITRINSDFIRKNQPHPPHPRSIILQAAQGRDRENSTPHPPCQQAAFSPWHT